MSASLLLSPPLGSRLRLKLQGWPPRLGIRRTPHAEELAEGKALHATTEYDVDSILIPTRPIQMPIDAGFLNPASRWLV